jgi:hypothetical protein
MTDHREHDEGAESLELTSSELAALAALPRERDPGQLLEERTVRALREEGLLGSPTGSSGRAAPATGAGDRHRPWWRSAAAIAAGFALFAGGLSLGQVLGARQTVDAFQTVFEEGDALLAAQVQRTGSDYVAALSALSGADGSAVPDTSQALEVALTALWAAANQIVLLAPDDPLAARILQGFEAKAQESDDYGSDNLLLVEF